MKSCSYIVAIKPEFLVAKDEINATVNNATVNNATVSVAILSPARFQNFSLLPIAIQVRVMDLFLLMKVL